MLFGFLFRNLRGYRRLVVLAICVTVTQVGSDICAAFPLKFIPSKVTDAGADPSCTFPFLNPILDWFDKPQLDPALQLSPFHRAPVTLCPITNPNATPLTSHHSVIGVVVFSVLMLIFFGTLSALLAFLDLYLAAYVAQHLSARLRNQLFDHLQRLSLDWHGKQKKGDLVQRVTGNIADVEKLVTDGLVDLLSGILTLAGVTAVMLVLSWQYTVISLAVAPALFLTVLGYTKHIKVAAKKAAKATGQVADVATEDINALTVIKVFTREEPEVLRFGRYVDLTRRAALRARGLQAQFVPLVAVLLTLGTAIVIGVGGYVAAGYPFRVGPFFTISPDNGVDVGLLVLFLTFIKLLYQPMRDLSKLTALASTASSGAERIQEVLDQAPEVLDSRAPYDGPTRLRGELTFEHVVFGYVPERPVLQGINLHIPAGRKIALVGLSGGGKTTLVKLIPRFYEVQRGVVRIDGIDNRNIPLRLLRQNVSMVLQDSVLFEGTVRENIAIGRPDASDEEIVEAAQKANIHHAIEHELGGYDRLVREQGKDLSGGQRQRIAIARAILRDAPILILDEPTAALDVESESEVMHALDKLIVGRTVLMISHRLSTLGNVEEIIVLKEGHIVEQGSFRDLKRRGGVFAALLEEQNRYNLEKAGASSILRSAYVPLPVQEVTRPRPERRAPVVTARGPVPSVARANPDATVVPAGNLPRRRQLQPAWDQNATRMGLPAEACVVVEVDGQEVARRQLDKPVLTVGRRSENDIAVPCHRVSRVHARLLWQDGAWLIEDAESLNGLVYQGRHVDRMALRHGDSVYMAPTAVLRYQVTSPGGR